MTCQRCGKTAHVYTGSYFNTQIICDDCSDAERAHPKFQEAKDAELAAVVRGDYNFPGIGLPPELIGGGHALIRDSDRG